MEQNVGRKGGLKKWVLAVVVLVALGAGGYYGFSNGYLQPLIDSLGNPKLETARGVIRDLRRMDLPDGKHFNIFLLEAETGELIPLCLDYDNHGLKDGDRIEAVYDTHRRYYTLADPATNAAPNFIARLSVVHDFHLVKDGDAAPKAEKE